MAPPATPIDPGVSAREGGWRLPFSPTAGVAGALGLATLSLFAGLGASSLFVDEVYSWIEANASTGRVHAEVVTNEIAPATYFFALHGWIAVFGDGEWAMRLPSALAAVALVGAVAWLTERTAGRTAAVVAALLTASCPLVLQYGQQVRGYIFAMLAVTIAVACALELSRAAPERRRRWYLVTLAAIVAAFWIHYSSGLIVFPLLVWVATRSDLLSLRARAVGVGVAALLCAVWLRDLHDQLQRHTTGLEGFANLNAINLAKVLGAPFDGRQVQSGGAPLQKLAALLCVWALVALLRDRTLPWAGTRGVAALAAFPLGLMIARAATGPDVATSRYVAVAAPLMLVSLGAWAVRLPARRAGLVVGTLLVIAVVGTVRSHLPGGHDSDTRGAIGYVAAHEARGEAVVVTSQVGLVMTDYYVAHDLPAGVPQIDVGTADALKRIQALDGAWLITRDGLGPQTTGVGSRFLQFTVTARRHFGGNSPLTVTHLQRNRPPQAG
jgi:mannosyltransferase